MKNLFVSFTCQDEKGSANGNICLPSPSKIEGKYDIISLQEYIEMAYGLQEVIINNWRRME